jgi:hypothetical protein
MAAVPRGFLAFGASLLSARAASRLRANRKGDKAQQLAFASMVPKLAAATEWRESGVEPRMDYEAFREKLRLKSYEEMVPLFERMQKGEPDVLWPGACQIYAQSAGISSGTPKLVPVNDAMLAHFKHASLDSILWYTGRVKRSSVFRGRHLCLGGSTALERIPTQEPFEAYAGSLSAIAALNIPAWAEKQFMEPGAEIAKIADWSARLDAIAARTAGTPPAEISLLAGMPSWTVSLAESILAHRARLGTPAPNLQAVWPRLECLVHCGIPIAPYLDELRTLLGPGVRFQEVFIAAEGFIAAQDADHSLGLRLMVDAGIFFEFLPMAAFSGGGRLASLSSKVVPLSGVTTGVDYALIVTTPAGLVRYAIGDVVRFVSTEPPRIVYVGRTDLRLNTFGENVSETEITNALVAVCRRSGWKIVRFHVAPLSSRSALGQETGRHEWWVELKAGTQMTPTGPIIATELDRELKALSPNYTAKRGDGTLDAPFVRLVMPGVFEHWMRHHGKWGGQNKMPRCRGDRLIADELGAALQFAKD